MSIDVAAEIRAESARQGMSMAAVAESTGMGYRTVTRKVAGDSPLTWEDIERFAATLRLLPSALVLSAERRAEEGEREVRSRTQASDAVGHAASQPTQPATSEVALAGVSAQEVLDHREECPECGVGATLEAAARHLGTIRAAYREAVAGLDAADLAAHVEVCDSCWSEDEAREHLLGTGVA